MKDVLSERIFFGLGHWDCSITAKPLFDTVFAWHLDWSQPYHVRRKALAGIALQSTSDVYSTSIERVRDEAKADEEAQQTYTTYFRENQTPMSPDTVAALRTSLVQNVIGSGSGEKFSIRLLDVISYYNPFATCDLAASINLTMTALDLCFTNPTFFNLTIGPHGILLVIEKESIFKSYSTTSRSKRDGVDDSLHRHWVEEVEACGFRLANYDPLVCEIGRGDSSTSNTTTALLLPPLA
eukprot:gene35880-46577_t